MTPDERNAILGGVKLTPNRTLPQYKRWASKIVEQPDSSELIESSKSRLINAAKWTPEQANALFDMTGIQKEFIASLQTDFNTAQSAATTAHAGVKAAELKIKGLDRQANPYGFDRQMQELSAEKEDYQSKYEDALDSQAAIGERLVARADNFGEDDETAHLMRQLTASTLQQIDPTSRYTAKPNGVYKDGKQIDPSLGNEILANSAEYGTYLAGGIVGGFMDSKVRKNLKSAGKFARIGGPYAMVAMEAGITATQAMSARAENRARYANMMGEVLSTDWNRTKMHEDIERELWMSAGAVGAGVVAGRVLYAVFGKGDIVSNDAFEAIKNQTGLSLDELKTIKNNFRDTEGNIDITLHNRLWPTRVLHSIKRPESFVTEKKVKFDDLTEEEQIIAALSKTGNARYQNVITNAVENRPHIRREAALNTAINKSKLLKERVDKLTPDMELENVRRDISGNLSFVRSYVDEIYEKLLKIPNDKLSHAKSEFLATIDVKGGELYRFAKREIDNIDTEGDSIYPSDLIDTYRKIILKESQLIPTPKNRELLTKAKTFINDKLEAAGLKKDEIEDFNANLNIELELSKIADSAIATSLAKKNITAEETFNIFKAYHSNQTDPDYSNLIRIINKFEGNDKFASEQIEKGLIQFATYQHLRNKTPDPNSDFVIDFVGLQNTLKELRPDTPEIKNTLHLIKGLSTIYQNNVGLLQQHHRSLKIDETGKQVFLATTIEGRTDMITTNIMMRGIFGFIPWSDSYRTYQLQRAIFTFLDDGGIKQDNTAQLIKLAKELEQGANK